MSSHSSKMNITELLTELLLLVFKLFLSWSGRTVKTCMPTVFTCSCTGFKNSELSTLEKGLASVWMLWRNIRRGLEFYQFLTLSRKCNVLETVRSRYWLLRAVT
jgi:hypothetical protein